MNELKHEIKICTICQQKFECKVGNITECQCFTIQLSLEEMNLIEQAGYTDCLCIGCLRSLKEKISLNKALNSAQ